MRVVCVCSNITNVLGVTGRCRGNPDVMLCLSFWYSGSLLAALRSSAMRSDSSVHVIALISAADMAAMSSILSASVSSGCGSAVGLRDNASGALFRVPFSQFTVNAYHMILVFRRCSRGFWILSNMWIFKMGMSGWWSVMTKN